MLLELKNVNKTYTTESGVTCRALNNVSLSFEGKGLVFLCGKSGSGKSTLLNVIGGLDGFDTGELVVCGKNLRTMSDRETDSYRNTLTGFVFQEFNLLETFNTYDNVKLALDMQSSKEADRVTAVLEQTGIAEKASAKITHLSGGQRQRAAIARALIKAPRILLADEPTGALDQNTGMEIMRLFKELSSDMLIIVVSHDTELAATYADRIIEMKDGMVCRDVKRKEKNEKVELPDIVLTSNALVRVEAGKTLNDADVEQIVNAFSSSVKKTYINVDTNPKRIKALFPHLSEAVDEHIETDTAESDRIPHKFVPYRAVKTEHESVEFKNARLPNKSALRLGFNNLNHKKGRLILTIFMALSGFLAFAAALALSLFDIHKAVSYTITDQKLPYVSFINSGQSYDRYTRIPDRAVSALTQQAERDCVYSTRFLPMRVGNAFNDGLLSYFGLSHLSVFCETESVKNLNLKIIYGSAEPADTQTLIMSRTAVELFIKCRVKGFSDLASAVGTSFELGGSLYTVGGIFDSVPLDSLSGTDYGKARELASSLLGAVFVKPGFFQSRAQEYTHEVLDVTFMDENIYFSDNRHVVMASEAFLEQTRVTDFTGNKILVHPDALKYFTIDFNSEFSFILKTGSMPIFASNSIEIVLSDRIPYTNAEYIYVTKEIMSATFENKAFTGQIFVSYSSRTELSRILKHAAQNGLSANGDYASAYVQSGYLMNLFKNVMYAAAGVLCLVTVVLLYGFISQSIRLTGKQIGILRALGAKRMDTFKIYAMESLLVAAISAALSMIMFLVIVPLANAVFSKAVNSPIHLVMVHPLVFIFVALLAFVVSVLSALLTLRKFNRITPISAITGK